MDAILDEIGDNQNIRVKYSTAKEFFEATYEANRKAEKELNLYEEDFSLISLNIMNTGQDFILHFLSSRNQ